MAPMNAPPKQELIRVPCPLNLSQEFCVSTSLYPQDETVVIPALGAESSFTASIMVLKLVVKRSLLVVVETMQLALLGACLPTPRIKSMSFPLKPGQEKHFFRLGTARAGKPMSRAERAISSHAEACLISGN